MKAAASAALIVLGMTTIAIDATSSAHAQAVCPVLESQALDEAQRILKIGDQTQLDIALACLMQALVQTRSDLEALRDGRLPFSGQVNAPKGVMITRPSVREGR